jgi:6-phosphogluconate dehydrogenase
MGQTEKKAQVGMIGLAVMGANLAKNLERNGFRCAVFNRSYEVTEKFISETSGKNFVSSKTLGEFVSSLEAPRKIFIMIQAGAPVDAVIEALLPLLAQGDIIIDGGNAHFNDTLRREKYCSSAGISFLGVGISGGEEGALNGASIMPGGPKDAWEKVSGMLEKISAYADGPCTTYIGPDGSGHFVKMVHNGIEYGDMQLIAEAYDILRNIGGCKPPELSEIFHGWNEGVLQSYLIEITSKIFRKKESATGGYLVDYILDKAGQKGTGKWTVQVGLDLGVAIPTISAAVDARVLSSLKVERAKAALELQGPRNGEAIKDRRSFVASVHDALYCAKIMSYAQGMALLGAASKEWKWDLKLGEIAAIWKGGCIIRARFLDEIRKAYAENRELSNLLLSSQMKREVTNRIENLRSIVSLAALHGIPVPGFGASLSYFDSYRTANLPQNLTQAQRDFFGAHTYQRVDTEGSFHTEWEG